MAKAEEKITQMYDAQLKNQKAQLQKDNDAANASLDKAQRENQKATDASLNRVAVEAQKDMMNDAEYYAASGLSSGARAQARLSRSNQQAADMTALRQAGLEADAEAKRQRALLAKEYAAAITQAQAENDLKKAQALYEQAQLEEQRLLQKQLAEEETLQAQIKAQGDFAAQQAKLQQERELAAAELLAENGDYSRLAQIYGLTDNEVAMLSGETPKITPPPGKKPVNPLSGMTAIDFQTGKGAGQPGIQAELSTGGWETTQMLLAQAYPGGRVTSPSEWESLKALYGESKLRSAGFYPYVTKTPARNNIVLG